MLVQPESMKDVRSLFEMLFDVPVPNILLVGGNLGPGVSSESVVDPMLKCLGHITKSLIHS